MFGASFLHALRIYFSTALLFAILLSVFPAPYGFLWAALTLYATWGGALLLFLPLFVLTPPGCALWRFFLAVPVLIAFGPLAHPMAARDSVWMARIFFGALALFACIVNRRRSSPKQAAAVTANAWPAGKFFRTICLWSAPLIILLSAMAAVPWVLSVLELAMLVAGGMVLVLVHTTMRKRPIVEALFVGYLAPLASVAGAMLFKLGTSASNDLLFGFYIGNVLSVAMNLVVLPAALIARFRSRQVSLAEGTAPHR